MVSVDMSGERFGDKVSIAHLASFDFAAWDSQAGHVYDAAAELERNWKWELEGEIEMEYATGVSARFKDGSALHVAAWGDCCKGQGSGCKWCGQ